MLKILHTADIHLGATLIKLGEKKDDQRIQIQKTFENIVKLAIEKQVDLFLIAGDLFDESKPDKGLVDFALSCFAQLNDRHIYTCISLGTHDFLQSGSVFADLDVSSLPYIKIFNDQASNAITIDELSTIVYCNCALSNKSSASPLDGIIRNDQYKYNIAIAHGSVQIPGKSSQNDSPIGLDEIANSHMDYIALGHWHNQQDVSQGGVRAWYAGAPEMIDLDQSASGKILLVTIDDVNNVSIESVQVGKRIFDTLKVSTTTVHNAEELLVQIRQNANPDLVRKVEIEGIRNIDFGELNIEDMQRRLKDEFFYLLIKDMTSVSTENIDQEIEGNILKMKYVEHLKKLQKEDAIYNEALTYGLLFLDGKSKVY